MATYEIYNTSLGKMLIAAENDQIIRLSTVPPTLPEGMVRQETPLLRQVAQQLAAYLRGEGDTLAELPLSPKGTEFQQRVWQALRTVPYGETRSYGWLAQAVGNPKAMRAVGGANGKNPIMLAIPCHRIVGADGSLGGFSSGLEMKTALLKLEGSFAALKKCR